MRSNCTIYSCHCLCNALLQSTASPPPPLPLLSWSNELLGMGVGMGPWRGHELKLWMRHVTVREPRVIIHKRGVVERRTVGIGWWLRKRHPHWSWWHVHWDWNWDWDHLTKYKISNLEHKRLEALVCLTLGAMLAA